MQLGFLQNKSCLKLSLFCMRTDDWLNFHVKFQSVHVNITSTAHHFFFFFFPFLLHISKTCQTKKKTCQTQNKCLHTCNVYKYSKNKQTFYMLLTVSNLSDYWMLCETCVTCHTKHSLQFKEHPKLRKCSNITLEYVHSIKTNKNKYLFMIHGVCLILKEKLFFPCHTCFSVTVLRVGCSTLKWMNPLKNCT